MKRTAKKTRELTNATIKLWSQKCGVTGGIVVEITITNDPGQGKLGVKFESLEPAGMLRVKSLSAGCAMDTAGAQVGDLLVSVNGEASNHDNVSQLLRYPMCMGLLRGAAVTAQPGDTESDEQAQAQIQLQTAQEALAAQILSATAIAAAWRGAAVRLARSDAGLEQMYERHEAATSLQAVWRGHKIRVSQSPSEKTATSDARPRPPKTAAEKYKRVKSRLGAVRLYNPWGKKVPAPIIPT